MTRLTIFSFSGRRENMEVQMPYLIRLLDQNPNATLDLWDLTRTPEDQEYLRTLDGAHEGRVRVLGMLHPGHPIACRYPEGYPNGRRPRGWPKCECLKHRPPYEGPYKWYAQRNPAIQGLGFHRGEVAYEPGDIFVKVDDDVLFLETDRFGDLIAPLADHPNRIISANVINNAVCAKYEPELANHFVEEFSVGVPKYRESDRPWWGLHTNPSFAADSHDWFLDKMAWDYPYGTGYVRTRPGEAISINCIAFTYTTMQRLAWQLGWDHRLGDEGVVDQRLPWIARSFRAAHLAFGPQEASLDLDWWRARYTQLRREYL